MTSSPHPPQSSTYTSSHIEGLLHINSLRSRSASLAVPGSQLEGRKRISEQLHPSTRASPPSNPAPTAAVPPHGPTETTPALLTRTGRE